ncbi:MAG: hypothetical protein WB992_15820 [Bryobacteraceae bacterium]
MTPRQARTERRTAERKQKKAEIKRNKAASSPAEDIALFPPGYQLEDEFSPELMAEADAVRDSIHRAAGVASPPSGFVSQTRAEINRANSQHSTGPRSPEGKLASSLNSLKHGLASGEIIIPGEDPAAFDALLHDLLEEHQPANPTEELLVKEMAQSYWLTQRALRFQNRCFTENGVDEKRLALYLRYQTTHDRAFHKALTTLIKLRKEPARRFVSQAANKPGPQHGFASQNPPPASPQNHFVRQNASAPRISDKLCAS